MRLNLNFVRRSDDSGGSGYVEVGVSGLSNRDVRRLKGQRQALRTTTSHAGCGLSQRDSDRHLGDITEALVLIHCGDEAPGYRFETRRQMEAWFRKEGWVTPDDLDAWYGIVLEGGNDERINGWLAAWKAVGLARVHALLQSLNQVVARKLVSAGILTLLGNSAMSLLTYTG